MTSIIELDSSYSTTRRVIKADHEVIANAVKQSNKPEDKFKTILFLPEGEGRKSEGGLRTKGYFKVGGIIPDNAASSLTTHSSPTAKPLVTVVTVVYNGEKFLEETILSVINQTYDNVEYIIIDGGSTDGTLDIIRKYEHAIDYWVSEKDKGIYNAMNKGIDLASGVWINFMNAGDAFFNLDSLGILTTHMNDTGCKIIYGDYAVIYPKKIKLGRTGSLKHLWKGSQFSHQSTFISANYHKANKYNDCHAIVADFEFFYNANKNLVPFKYIKETVSIVEPVGLSDSSRVECYIGFWGVVDKSFLVNLFYLKIIFWQVIKIYIKKIIRH